VHDPLVHPPVAAALMLAVGAALAMRDAPAAEVSGAAAAPGPRP
jgi:hypothetical protein